ncbi:MAG: hypothetical protein ACRCTE_11480 [Cellulosilyticaceae bacterium]
MNKKILGISAGAVGMCVLVGALSANTIWAKVAPTSFIAKAGHNTLKALEEESKQRVEVMGIDVDKSQAAYEQQFEIKIKELFGEDAEDMRAVLGGSKISATATHSENQNLVDLNFKGANGMGLSLSLFGDEAQIGFRVKDLTKEYLMIDLENFAKKFNNSALIDVFYWDELPEDIALGGEEKAQFLEPETLLELQEMYVAAVKDSETKYEGKKDLQGQKVRQFSIVVPEDVVEELVIETFDSVMTDKNFEDYLMTMLMMDSYYTAQEIKEELVGVRKQFKEMAKSLDYGDGLELVMSVNKKNQLIYCESLMDIKNQYGRLKYEFEGGFLGKKVITDLIEGELVLTIDEQKVKGQFVYESNLGKKENELTQSMEMKLGDSQYTAFDISCETRYSPKLKEDNYQIDGKLVLGDEIAFALNGEGAIVEDQKQKTLQVELDTLKFTAKDLSGYYEDMGVVGELQYHYAPIPVEDLAPSSKKDLFGMTEDELYSLVWDMSRNLANMYNPY